MHQFEDLSITSPFKIKELESRIAKLESGEVNLDYKILYDDVDLPTQAYDDPLGWDLAIHHTVAGEKPRILKCHTGIAVQPENRYYVRLFPRSGLYKTGYILANSVGNIEWSYRGELIVVLYKYTDTAEELKKGYRPVMMMGEKHYKLSLNKKGELGQTERGDKGFGSSN